MFISGERLSAGKIENVCTGLALQCTMKSSLKSLPENVHWHYKIAKQQGVLEITLLLKENKLILNCKKNRTGEWIDKAAENIQQGLNLKEVK